MIAGRRYAFRIEKRTSATSPRSRGRSWSKSALSYATTGVMCVKLGCAPITSIFLCDENVEGIILIDIRFWLALGWLNSRSFRLLIRALRPPERIPKSWQKQRVKQCLAKSTRLPRGDVVVASVVVAPRRDAANYSCGIRLKWMARPSYHRNGQLLPYLLWLDIRTFLCHSMQNDEKFIALSIDRSSVPFRNRNGSDNPDCYIRKLLAVSRRDRPRFKLTSRRNVAIDRTRMIDLGTSFSNSDHSFLRFYAKRNTSKRCSMVDSVLD